MDVITSARGCPAVGDLLVVKRLRDVAPCYFTPLRRFFSLRGSCDRVIILARKELLLWGYSGERLGAAFCANERESLYPLGSVDHPSKTIRMTIFRAWLGIIVVAAFAYTLVTINQQGLIHFFHLFGDMMAMDWRGSSTLTSR